MTRPHSIPAETTFGLGNRISAPRRFAHGLVQHLRHAYDGPVKLSWILMDVFWVTFLVIRSR